MWKIYPFRWWPLVEVQRIYVKKLSTAFSIDYLDILFYHNILLGTFIQFYINKMAGCACLNFIVQYFKLVWLSCLSYYCFTISIKKFHYYCLILLILLNNNLYCTFLVHKIDVQTRLVWTTTRTELSCF